MAKMEPLFINLNDDEQKLPTVITPGPTHFQQVTRSTKTLPILIILPKIGLQGITFSEPSPRGETFLGPNAGDLFVRTKNGLIVEITIQLMPVAIIKASHYGKSDTFVIGLCLASQNVLTKMAFGAVQQNEYPWRSKVVPSRSISYHVEITVRWV